MGLPVRNCDTSFVKLLQLCSRMLYFSGLVKERDKGGREGGRDGGRESEKEGGREGKEGGREGGRSEKVR